MYFYIYKGQLYWGRYQNISPHRNFHTWIFRNKPAEPGRVYLTGQESFVATPSRLSKTKRAIYVVKVCGLSSLNDKTYLPFVIMEGFCYRLSGGGLTVCGSTNKNEKTRQEFKNMFKNRLNEYKGRYFLPIEKNMNYV